MKNDKFFKIGHLSLLNDHLSFEFGSLRRQKLVNEFASFPNDVSGEQKSDDAGKAPPSGEEVIKPL
jgi:hypothetical protein